LALLLASTQANETDSAIRAAKSKTGRTVKLSDGGGLQLRVKPSGSKLWNLAYRFAGKQRKLATGSYPDIGLKEARAKREEAKKLLASGWDPSQQKRLGKLASESQKADTFEAISREVLEKKCREGRSERTVSKAEWLFDLATPALGPRPSLKLPPRKS
jgi:Arm DNA-binding domain